MTIKMIIATDQNFGIGRGTGLPWGLIKEDLQYFKEQTESNIVLMGSKTHVSLPMYPKGLPKRYNYIVTSKRSGLQEHGIVAVGMEDFIRCLESGNSVFSHKDVWIIGGASIYKQLLPYVEEVHHTLIDGVYDCDTFFDMSFLEDWKLVGGKDLSENAVLNIWRKG